MKNKIVLFKVFMAPTAAEEVSKVLNSGYIGLSPKVEEFEKELKHFFNHDYV
jgi:dTDP-4-amino-4,6-dideoxygalactose transaminase